MQVLFLPNHGFPKADTNLSSLFLFILFFPRTTPLNPPTKPAPIATSDDDADSQPTSFTTAIVIFVLCILHAFAVLFFSLLMNSLHPKSLPFWAYFLGVFGTILAVIQFLPQIYTTWKLQAVGSLSIPMMCIQTPGSFVWVGSLAARLGWAGWSTWGIYAVTGVLQGCLLVMGIAFELRDRRRKRDIGSEGIETVGGEENHADEQTPLTGNEE